MPAATVDEYLASLDPDRRAVMEELRGLVNAAAPNATETIAYAMPAIRGPDGRFIVSYDAFKSHYSVFAASAGVVAACGDELTPYLAGKGTIRFPADQPLPASLITRIVEARVRENVAAAEARAAKRART
jgi:uncharacterized protein YdhG (YjbR/CyaY superfamily)